MKKGGISAIVATVLTILITVVGVAIIWVAIIPMFQNAFDFDDPNARVDIVTSEGYTVYDERGYFSVQVKRGADESSLRRIQIIMNFDGNSVSHIKDAPEPNQLKTYYFDITGYGVPDSIKVAPIFSAGSTWRVGEVSSSAKLSFGTFSNLDDFSEIFGEGVCDSGISQDCGEPMGGCGFGAQNCIDDFWGSCEYVNGDACDDENACTLSEECSSGVCGGGVLIDCDAEKPFSCMTTLPCDSVLGCVYDSSECGCPGGLDSECPVNVDPCKENICSDLMCSEVFANEGGSCDDGDSCNSGESCSSGSCGGGVFVAPVCSAVNSVACGNPITPSNGCGTCSDGTYCDMGICESGACVLEGKWVDASSIVVGLFLNSNQATVDHINIDGVDYLIYMDYNGPLTGYKWGGTQWDVDSSIIQGVPSADYFEAYNNNGEYHLLTSLRNYMYYSYSFVGSAWETDNSIRDGILISDYFQQISFFEWNNEKYLMIGVRPTTWDSTYKVYKLSTEWVEDSFMSSGLPVADTNYRYPSPTVFYVNDDLYMISGDLSDFVAWKWSGSAWVEQFGATGSILEGLPDMSGASSIYPEVFDMNGETYMIVGGSNSGFIGRRLV